MSRLEELIAELCPDGVEYKTLGEVATISRGGSFQKKDFLDSGFPCIHYGQIYTQYGLFADKTLKFISPVVAEKQRKAVKNDVVMAVTSENIDDVCKCLAWLGEDEVAVSGHTAIIHHDQNPKYLTYYFHSEMFAAQKRRLAHGTKVIEVTPDKLNDVKIPLPPLEVQREIVRILDAYSERVAELTDRLAAELDARKKQYEYYRDDLCNFTNRPDVPFLSVGELFEFKNGLNKGKEFFGKGSPIVNFTDVFNNRWMTKETLKGLVEVTDKEKELYGAKKNDVFFTRTSETQEEIGMTSVLLDDIEGCVFSGFVLRARPKTDLLLPKFCSYYFSSYSMRKDIVRYSTFTTRALTSGSKLSKLMFPLPPLAEQERIVAILDRFDKLCNDITSGIPAEIEARRKQYEHYRDRLLTFKEKTA